MAKSKSKANSNLPVEDKLRNLFDLQTIDSKIDEIQKLKGELPMEVQDLEDELVGLDTRLEKLEMELKDLEAKSAKYTSQIKESETLIERYERQQNNVKNNREYEALVREIELQKLDIQLANKRIRETRVLVGNKELTLEAAKKKKENKAKDLERKQEELKKIITKTDKEEKKLERKTKTARKKIEERLLDAYDRIRGAYRNGLSVVTVERDACGGCHNQVPPQVQLEIRQRKKIIVCEHCGRVLVDDDIQTPKEEIEVEKEG